MVKIYTKQGDKGMSATSNGIKLSKSNLCFEVLGELDELHAWIGLLRDFNELKVYQKPLIAIQKNLLSIGAYISSQQITTDFPTQDTLDLMENQIDQIQKNLPPLKNFILFGGHQLISYCQIARSVCRRCERHIVSYNQTTEIPEVVLSYLNRLSDYLFCLSRQISNELRTEEIIWKS